MAGDDIVHTVTLSLGEGYEFVARFEGIPEASPLRLDEPAPVGHGSAPNAAALLAAAVGNCLAASLTFCLRRSRANVEAMTAHVSARVSRNDAGRYRIAGMSVELEPDVETDDGGRLQRCEELFEDFCMVTESVRAGIPVDVTVKEVHRATAE